MQPVLAAAGDGAVRFALCCTDITPIAARQPGSLIARLTDSHIEPLAVGHAHRLATPAQRKALALRDGGGGTARPRRRRG